jgi:hypothetical protein
MEVFIGSVWFKGNLLMEHFAGSRNAIPWFEPWGRASIPPKKPQNKKAQPVSGLRLF